MYEPEYEKENFQQSDNLPELSNEDKNNIQLPVTQEEMLMALQEMQNDKGQDIDGLLTKLQTFCSI